ncbi:MAG: hypothetical protein IKK00_00275 [Oscillospiraceae bacterium]|nr:hypothetical protein [Oscillospiraceae bacterium]
MKKSSTRTVIVIAAVLILLVAAFLFYSRPMTIPQRYPMLALDKCSGITGYYFDGTGAAPEEFTIDKNSEEFEMLCNLLYEKDYRRSLRDLFPNDTTRYHSTTQPDEFLWEVFFHFEDVEFPDGSISSRIPLRIQSWFGELEIHFDGDMLSCNTNKQKVWEREVLDTILRATETAA